METLEFALEPVCVSVNKNETALLFSSPFCLYSDRDVGIGGDFWDCDELGAGKCVDDGQNTRAGNALSKPPTRTPVWDDKDG